MKSLNASSPFVATLTITQGKITTTDTITTFVRGPVVWVVVNNDPYEYFVDISYSKMKHKGNNKPGHPFPKNRDAEADVPPAPNGGTSLAAIVDVIKGYNPGTKHDVYKYTVDLLDAAKKPIDFLDPDVDVVDPFPFEIEH
jgi:hypothetical protein